MTTELTDQQVIETLAKAAGYPCQYNTKTALYEPANQPYRFALHVLQENDEACRAYLTDSSKLWSIIWKVFPTDYFSVKFFFLPAYDEHPNRIHCLVNAGNRIVSVRKSGEDATGVLAHALAVWILGEEQMQKAEQEGGIS